MNYQGHARNALARTLDSPAIRVRPWGRLAWLLIAVLAAVLTFACVERMWGPVDQERFTNDGGVW